MSSGVTTRGRSAVTLATAAAVLSLGSASAIAAGGNKNIAVQKVVRGSAQFSTNGNVTTIRAADRTVINYSSFNIGMDQTVRFVQPSKNARVLNRINSSEPTRIDGKLTANGIVYLVNPVGVMFGKNSVVNVGQIFAAAGNISDENFLSGVNRFNGSGLMSAAGTITGDGVHLVGTTVTHSGSIEGGLVTMVAGNDVLVGTREGHVMVKVGTTAPQGDAKAVGVENSGTVRAKAVAFGAGDIYSMAINHSGTIKAKEVAIEGQGKGVVQVSGSIDASDRNAGSKGGSVVVTGEKVALVGANVDASGDAGGGAVRVGGDVQGKGEIAHAARIYVDAASTIKADAIASSDGGSVVVWSDEATFFYGNLSAKPASGGKGGFAEISSKGMFDFKPQNLDLGIGGNLLLDPLALDITNGTANNSGFSPPTDQTEAFTDDAGLHTLLNPDTDFVNVAAGTTITLQADDSIVVSSAFDVATATGQPDVSLVLQSGQHIVIGAPITVSGAGTLTVSADDNGDGTGILQLQDNAPFGLTGSLNSAGGAITVSAAVIDIFSGTSINGGSGTVTIKPSHAAATVDVGVDNGGSFVLDNAEIGAITAGRLIIGDRALANALHVQGVTPSSPLMPITLRTGGTLDGATATMAVGPLFDLTLDVAGGIGLGAGGALFVDANRLVIINEGGFNIDAGGPLFEVNVKTNGSTPTQTLTSPLLTYSVSEAGGLTTLADVQYPLGVNFSYENTGGGIVVAPGAGQIAVGPNSDVTLKAAGPIVLGTSNVLGALSVTAGGSITQTAPLTVVGPTSVTRTSAGVTDLGLANDLGGPISIGGAVGSVSIKSVSAGASIAALPANVVDLIIVLDAAPVVLPAVHVAGDLSVSSGGPLIAQTGPVVVVGNTTVQATGGVVDVLLDTHANDLAGTVDFNNGPGGAMRDVKLRNTSSLAVMGLLPPTLEDLTVVFDVAPLNFGAGTISGAVNATAGGDITLGGTLTAASFVLSSTGGAIVDGNGAAVNLQAPSGSISLSAAMGIGSGGLGLETATPVLAARNSTSGDIAINNSVGGLLTISTIGPVVGVSNAASGGAIVLVNSSPITVDQDVIDSGGGNISISTANSIANDNLTINARVVASGGNGNIVLDSGQDLIVNATGASPQISAGTGTITGLAVHDLTLAAGVTIQSAGGAIALTADTAGGPTGGSLTMADSSTVNAGTGTITLQSDATVTVGHLITSSAAANAVTIITETGAANPAAGASAGEDIQAPSGGLVINASSGIGITQALTTRVASADMNSAAGDIQIAETDGLALTKAITAGGAVIVNSTAGDVALKQVASQTLNVTADSISRDAAANIVVDGLATMSAGLIAMSGTGTADFGSLNLTGGAVTLSESSATNLAAVNVASLDLSSAGAIAQDASSVVTVTGLAKFTAPTLSAISLDANLATNNFGSILVSGGTVQINEASDSVITGVDANLFELTSAGTITEVTGATIDVDTIARFNAGSNIINLTGVGTTNNFGSLELNGGDVTISENGATALGTSTVGTLDLTSAGAITNTAGAAVNVGGRAIFNSGNNAITLGNGAGDTVDLGSVHVTGGDVVIEESSSTLLGSVSATSLNLKSGGAITQGASTSISTANVASFDAGAGNAVTLSSAGNNFGALSATGSSVTINEASGTQLQSLTATSLDLTSAGAITDIAGATIAVAGLATLNAGTSNNITLGDGATDTTNFGSVDITGADVVIREDSDAVLANVSVRSLDLTAAGTITQGSGANIAVTNLAKFDSGSAAISLDAPGGATNNFGSVAATGGAVVLHENSDTTLGAVDVASLDLISAGAVTQNSGMQVSGTTTVNAGASITLTQSINDLTGPVSLTTTGAGGAVTQDIRLTVSSPALTVATISTPLSTGETVNITNLTGDIDLALSTPLVTQDTVTIDAELKVLHPENMLPGVGGSVSYLGETVVGADLIAPSGVLSFTGSVTLANDAQIAAQTISINGGVSGTSATALTLTPGGGGASVSGAISSLEALTVNSASGGNVSLAGAISNLGSMTITSTGGGNVSLGGAITSVAGLTITKSSSGNVSLAGALSTIQNTLISSTAGGNVILSGPISWTGAGGIMVINSAGGGDVTLSGAISGLTLMKVTSADAGDVLVSGAISNLLMLEIDKTSAGDVSLTGPLSAISGVSIDSTSNGNITLAGAISDLGALTIGSNNGGDVTLSGAINGAFPLAITGSVGGDVSLGGTVGGSTALSSVNIGGAGNITVHAITTSGAISLKPAGGMVAGTQGAEDWRPAGLLMLEGNLRTTTGAGNITLGDDMGQGTDGQLHVPSVASIVGLQDVGGGQKLLAIDAGGTITMGQRQKMTVLNLVRLSAPGKTVSLSDVTTLLDMTVTAGPLVLQQRAAGRNLTNGGTLSGQDTGTDFVAGRNMNFTFTSLSGDATAVFAYAGSAPGNMGAARVRRVNFGPSFELSARLQHNSTVLDLSGNDAGAASATNVALLLPLETPAPAALAAHSIDPASLTATEQTNLAAMGIELRAATALERRESFDGWAMYIQGTHDERVADARLRGKAAEDLVEMYRSAFARKTTNPDGSVSYADNKAEVARSIANAVEGYTQVRAGTGKIDVFDLLAYMQRSPQHQEALGYVGKMRQLTERMETLGLTERETAAARASLLSSVRPAGIPAKDFETLVMTAPVPAQ